mgnify:FL=1
MLVEWCEGVGLDVSVRLKEPFDDNLLRLNADMARIFPQAGLAFRSMEQTMRSYSDSVRVFRNVTLLASVAILFIILLGLTGYVNDEIRLRSKEIAIRKVNGAETGDILRLLLRDVAWLSVPSVVVGTAGAWWVGRLWMEQFRDTVGSLAAVYIGAALLLLLLIAGVALSKAWRIARENPVRGLRSE